MYMVLIHSPGSSGSQDSAVTWREVGPQLGWGVVPVVQLGGLRVCLGVERSMCVEGRAQPRHPFWKNGSSLFFPAPLQRKCALFNKWGRVLGEGRATVQASYHWFQLGL